MAQLTDVQQQQYTMISRMLNAGIATEATSSNSAVPEESLRASLALLKPLGTALEAQHFEMLFDEISKVLSIRVNIGVVIEASDHKPWLTERRSEIDWRLWSAYRTWQVNSGRSPIVVDTLDRSLDIVLDHLGDPRDEGAWARRGLVIGDVQSGKTGTYLGLIDKAADAGYRVFILLTGNTESLRQQTQSRVDQGVIGRDSMSVSRATTEQANKPKATGIGTLLESTSSAMNMTTMTTDFRKNSIQAVDISPGPENLVFFVTKKNKTVLDRIADWLEKQDNIAGKLHVPLLLIDDEADYASVNTKNVDELPTAINAGIRRLLSLFSRSSYVGFTATPFANIFIDDEQDDDLFPRDFIYGLEAPTNYIGPQTLFGTSDAATESGVLQSIDDAKDVFPARHKSTLIVEELPESLLEAIRAFLLVNAIRDLRGQLNQPRAMLVNVSRFNLVQEQVFGLLNAELATYRNAIILHSRAYADGVDHALIRQVETTFENQFGHEEFSWMEVLRALPPAVAEVQALVVNSKADKKLEQDELSAAPPARVIAIGGDLLSRGLTLEGLTISYFYRHTLAADTLMQMGRWFGYREGYEDLCRVWIDESVASAYAHAADSIDELRLELKRMRNQKLTPQEYGLAVANHPGALLITARNKMRAAKEGKKQISLRGRSIESYRVSSNARTAQRNWDAADAMLEELRTQYGAPATSKTNRLIWSGVPKSIVADFLSRFRAHDSLELFQEGALDRFVRNASADDLQTWDVVVVEGRGIPKQVGGTEITLPVRSVSPSDDAGWSISGARQRVAGPGDVSAALSKEEIDNIRENYRADPDNAGKSSMPDAKYVEALTKPEILLYMIQAERDGKTVSEIPLTAVLLAIPGARDDDGRSRSNDEVTYTLNKPAQRLWFPEIVETSDGDDDY